MADFLKTDLDCNGHSILNFKAGRVAGIPTPLGNAQKGTFWYNSKLELFQFYQGNTVVDLGTVPGTFGDILTDHYSDIESATYYYYGLNRNGDWEFLRNLKEDINIETKATIVNNPGIPDLATAIVNRVLLTYS